LIIAVTVDGGGVDDLKFEHYVIVQNIANCFVSDTIKATFLMAS